MSKKNNNISYSRILEELFTVKYFVPFLITFLLFLSIFQFSYNFYLSLSLNDKENIIYASKFQTIVEDIAKKTVNKTEFNLVSEVYPLKLDYHVINKSHSAEEYDTLIKNNQSKSNLELGPDSKSIVTLSHMPTC